MGRPPKEINWEEFEKLCAFQCTVIEIASWFAVSEDTLQSAIKKHYGQTFSGVFKEKRTAGLISLRRKQFEVALSGNVTMLIWLGKQLLDQTDKVEPKEKDPADEPIKIFSTNISKLETDPASNP